MNKYNAAQSMIDSGTWTVDPDAGLVYSERTGKVLGHVAKDGYVVINLWVDKRHSRVRVSRVIWETVNGPIPDGMQIDHVNGVKTDNRVANLEPVTGQENVARAFRLGLRSTKLTGQDALEIYLRSDAGEPAGDLAAEYGVSAQQVYSIRAGRCWREYTQAAA